MKFVSFGDYMIHFSPVGYDRFSQVDSFRISFTGAEENVSAALALWGEDVTYLTRLPKNDLADRSIRNLKSFGIHTEFIPMGGDRMGTYYLEKGASIRSSKVIYDRKYSSFYFSKPSDYDFEGALKGADVLFLTGISAYLADNLFDCELEICKVAKKLGVKVYYDVNMRPSLCSDEKCETILRTLAPYIDTLICNEEHLKKLLHISSSFGEEEVHERLQDLAKQAEKILGIHNIALPVRRTLSASDNTVYAGFLKDGKFVSSKKFTLHIVDRVGGGDAFSAGLIYALDQKYPPEKALEFAITASALKHTVEGDTNMVSVDEILTLMKGNSWDVKR